MTLLSRFCALLLTGMVLVLVVFAVSPDAHQWLHADADHQDHACAITLYAHGATASLIGLILSVVSWCLLGVSLGAGDEFFLPVPCYLHLPGRGPPRG